MVVKNVEKKDGNLVTFQVEVDKDEFEQALAGAYLKNRSKVSVPGFRKGKAPRMVIEGMYGASVFYEDAIEEISPKAFSQGVEENGLKVVGRPNITAADVSDDKALTLAFESALYPEVELGLYKGIEAPREEINITDAQVDEYIDEIRKRNARKLSVDRAAKLGDTVTMDYDGYLDGTRFDGGKAEGAELELGSGQFVPGFEEQLVGMKTGEEKDIDITFPENYHEGLAGKAVVFKVKIHEITELELPAADDEFAKDVSEFDTLSEYRKAIHEQLLESRTKAVDEDFGYSVMQKAVENMKCDVPSAMIEERMGEMLNEYDRNLMQRGMRLEEYMRMSGMDPVAFQNMLKPQAEAQVRTDILLKAVAEAENIEVSEEDVDKAIADIAAAYHATVEQIKEMVPSEAMAEDMKKKKASDLIMSTAIPTAPVTEEAKEEKPAKKSPAKKSAKKADAQNETAAE